jgi:predicted ATPase
MGVAAPEQLLEREGELAVLEQLLERAREGDGRLMLLEGVAGIGKTRLLQSARGFAQGHGMRVLAARGTELEREFPFGLVRQLFEPLVHAASAEQRDQLLEGAARPAALVIGVETGGDSAPADTLIDPSFATLNSLYWLTSNLAEEAPLLLVVDDAHWADKASLWFLKFLLPRIADLPVLLAVAARPAEPGAEVAPLLELSLDPAARVLRPNALSEAAVRELVRARLPDADEAFCTACHEGSGGNPFMLRELLVELAAEGSTGAAAEAARVREVVPATIQRAVLARLARLPEEAHCLSRAVAVLGDDTDLGQAADLAGLERTAAAGAADAVRPASSSRGTPFVSSTRWCAPPSTRTCRPRRARSPTNGRPSCSRPAGPNPSGWPSTCSPPTPRAIPPSWRC